MKNLMVVCLLTLVSSCSYEKTSVHLGSSFDNTWSFSSTSNYIFDSDLIELKNGKAVLKPISLGQTTQDLLSGTVSGASLNSTGLSLTTSSRAEISTQAVLPARESDLLAYWKFDGNTLDSSINNIVGTVNGAAETAKGKIGEGLYLNGATDSFSVNITHLANVVTISSWFKVNKFENTFPRLFFSSAFDVYFNETTYKMNFISNRAGGVPDRGLWLVNTTFEEGRWYHLVLAYDQTSNSNDPIVYINGLPVSVSESSAPVGATLTSTSVILGDTSGGTRKFNGAYDELAVHSVVLSAEEVQSLYQAQSPNFSDSHGLEESWAPKGNQLVSYWNMDGHLTDLSSNNIDGAFNGDAQFSYGGPVGSHYVLFDGVGDWINYGVRSELDIAGAVTMSAWVRPTSLSQNGTVLRHVGAAQKALQILANGQVRFSSFSGVWDHLVSGSNQIININEWSHIVATRSSSDHVSLYINGQLAISGTLPAATAANTDFIIGSDMGGQGFMGGIDEAAVWSTDLTPGDVALIYNKQKQKFSGTFETDTIDLAHDSAQWRGLAWITELPFGKGLVGDIDLDGDADGDSLASYSALETDFITDLLGYWPLNNTYNDYSGANFNGTASGANFVSHCKLSSCASFTGAGQINLGDQFNFTIAPFSISLWFKGRSSHLLADQQILFNKRLSTGWGSFWELKTLATGELQFAISEDASATNSAVLTNGQNVFNDEWQHVVATREGTSVKLFVNGEEVHSVNSAGTAFIQNTADVKIAESGMPGYPHNFYGLIDEVSVWGKALSGVQVEQLYRRGANRIKLQVKSCVDVNCNCSSFNTSPMGNETDCDGDGVSNALDGSDTYRAHYSGPGGNGATYYSELLNRSSGLVNLNCSLNLTDSETSICLDNEINLSETSLPTLPNFSLASYPQFVSPLANRYVKVKVLLEADDNSACSGLPCFPSLQSLNLNPQQEATYSYIDVAIRPKAPITFNRIINAKIDADSCASFRLARQGLEYYYDSASWVVATESHHKNTKNELQNYISQFGDVYGAGELEVIGYLKSDTSQTLACSINEVDVRFE